MSFESAIDVIDRTADDVGELHSRLELLTGLAPPLADAVARAAALLDAADELLSRAYVEAAGVPFDPA